MSGAGTTPVPIATVHHETPPVEVGRNKELSKKQVSEEPVVNQPAEEAKHPASPVYEEEMKLPAISPAGKSMQ